MGSLGAVCFHTISSVNRSVPKQQWDVERFGMICETSAVFADWKEVILKLCKVSNDCTRDQIAALESLDMKLQQYRQLQRAVDVTLWPENQPAH